MRETSDFSCRTATFNVSSDFGALIGLVSDGVHPSPAFAGCL